MERDRGGERERPRRRAHAVRPRLGGAGRAPASVSATFVSAAALDAGIGGSLGTRRRLVAVMGTRSIRRDDLARNRTVPAIEVSPRDGTVTLEGRVLRTDPVTRVPLSRRYLLA